MKPSVKIHIGQYYASKDPAIISTILGSCVSVCLYDPKTKIGGMNHILRVGEDMTAFDESARYGINAMELLINRMLALNADRRSLRAKVFGGGKVLVGNGDNGVFSPGDANVKFAFYFLETEKIPIDGYNIGGNFARKIELNTSTGEVLMRKIKARFLEDIRVQEQKYRRQIQGQVEKPWGVAWFNEKTGV